MNFPWTGSIVPWSAPLRTQPHKNTRRPHEGILIDLPRGAQVTVMSQNGAWLHVKAQSNGKLLTGYISKELIAPAAAAASANLKSKDAVPRIDSNLAKLMDDYRNFSPKDNTRVVSPPPSSRHVAQPKSGARYIVQPKDTLSGIAAKMLGNAKRWPEIASLNKLDNPNFLLVGQQLELPGAQPLASSPFLVTKQSNQAQAPATLAWAQGSLFVVFEQLSETSGKLIRKVAVVPKDFSLLPKNPLGKITPAEHAMAMKSLSSQYLSTSQKVFGAPSINGTPLLIDIAKAEAAGARIVPMEQLVTELKQFAAQNPTAKARVDKLIDIIQTVEGEVLIEGKVDGKAVSKVSVAHSAYIRSAEDLWKKFSSRQITKAQLEAELKALEGAFSKARRIGRLGRALTVVGVIFTVKDVAEATQRSINQQSYKPLAAESIRQVGGWGGAIAGAKAGFAVGALFGIETGPGAVITGAIGAVIVGGAAYYGFDLLADKLSPN